MLSEFWFLGKIGFDSYNFAINQLLFLLEIVK